MKFDSVLRYEAKALAFHRMTGHWCPGKDYPAAGGPRDRKADADAWGKWNDEHGQALAKVFDAIEELTSSDEC